MLEIPASSNLEFRIMRIAVAAIFLLLLANVVAAQDASDSTVRIRKFQVTGETGLSIQQEQDLATRLESLKYTRDYASEIADRTRFALQDHGYFKAIVHDPTITMVQTLPKSKLIDVVIPVESGAMYYLGEITFKGQTVFPETELRAQFHIATGSVFNRTGIGKGLESLRLLYCHKGYVDLTMVPDTVVDESKHTVSIVVSVDEGDRYRYGKLTVMGDESVAGAKQKLLNGWIPYEGRLYDCSENALKDYFRDLHLNPDLQPHEIIDTSFDNRSHLVNLQIRLARPPFSTESARPKH